MGNKLEEPFSPSLFSKVLSQGDRPYWRYCGCGPTDGKQKFVEVSDWAGDPARVPVKLARNPPTGMPVRLTGKPHTREPAKVTEG